MENKENNNSIYIKVLYKDIYQLITQFQKLIQITDFIDGIVNSKEIYIISKWQLKHIYNRCIT